MDAVVSVRRHGSLGRYNSRSPFGAADQCLELRETPLEEGAIKAALHEDGYCLVRAVVPADVCQSILAGPRRYLESRGIVNGGTATLPWSGVSCRTFDRIELERSVVEAGVFDEYRRDSGTRLASIVRIVCGEDGFVPVRSGVLLSIPDDQRYVTEPHRDVMGNVPVELGARWWLPLTPLPYADGGLAVAEGSHRNDELRECLANGYRNRPTTEQWGLGPRRAVPMTEGWDVGATWRTSWFGAGDLIVLHPKVIHAGVPSVEPNVRLALVIRAAQRGRATANMTMTWPELDRLWNRGSSNVDGRDGDKLSLLWQDFQYWIRTGVAEQLDWSQYVNGDEFETGRAAPAHLSY